MDKQLILEKYKKQEDKILVSRLFDKIEICKKTNKVTNLDFLTPAEAKILENVINQLQIKNSIFYGGISEAQRKMLIIYPQKIEKIFQDSDFDFNNVIHVIRITIPTILKGQFEHRTYLGGLIKLGIRREKIGDIITYDEGADIIVSTDISKFVLSNLCQLTRFSKCNIELIKNGEIHEHSQQFNIIKIIVSSMRLDNVVSELAKTSRSKANEIIMQERVYINYECELKSTKLVKEKDIISIRGKGKYELEQIDGNTRSGRNILKIKQFI